MHTIFCLENLKGRDYLEDIGIDGKIIKWLLGKHSEVWTGYIWLRIGASGRLLWTW